MLKQFKASSNICLCLCVLDVLQAFHLPPGQHPKALSLSRWAEITQKYAFLPLLWLSGDANQVHLYVYIVIYIMYRRWFLCLRTWGLHLSSQQPLLSKRTKKGARRGTCTGERVARSVGSSPHFQHFVLMELTVSCISHITTQHLFKFATHEFHRWNRHGHSWIWPKLAFSTHFLSWPDLHDLAGGCGLTSLHVLQVRDRHGLTWGVIKVFGPEWQGQQFKGWTSNLWTKKEQDLTRCQTMWDWMRSNTNHYIRCIPVQKYNSQKYTVFIYR